MILQPCNQCRRHDGCILRAEKRAALRGLHLTVAKFACPIIRDDYRSGRRVAVRLMCFNNRDDDVEAEFIGTVMFWKGRKLLVHLDTGVSADNYESAKRIVKAWPKWVEPLAEPDRQTCEVCKLPHGAIVKDWACGCQPGYTFGEFGIESTGAHA